MTPRIEITKEERKAIEALEILAKKWPKSLWLFSASGTLTVMKEPPDGISRMNPGPGGGVNQDYIVTTISGIENDGGDW